MSILSDQLTVRPYSSPEAWKPGPLSTQSIQNIQNITRTFSKPVPSTPLRPARHVPIVEQKLANPAVQSQLAAIVCAFFLCNYWIRLMRGILSFTYLARSSKKFNRFVVSANFNECEVCD